MIFFGSIQYEIIKEKLYKLEVIRKYLHHASLEGGWCAHQPKWNYAVCECSILRNERRL